MKTVTILEERYEELLDIESMYQCLEDAGLNKWEGYKVAQKAWFDSETNDITDKL